jgi:hypothetical protein
MQYQYCDYKKMNSLDLLKVLAILGIGGLFFALIQINAIALPCLWKILFGVPCPGCGLTRAFTLITEFRLIEAMKMNIISVPLFFGGIVTICAAILELLWHKPTLSRLRHYAGCKGFIVFVATLTTISWVYNIARNI